MELRKLHTADNDIFVGYAESRIGGRSENQDSYSFCQTAHGFLVTVCDGMGGGPGGKTASSIAVTEIVRHVLDAPMPSAMVPVTIVGKPQDAIDDKPLENLPDSQGAEALLLVETEESSEPPAEITSDDMSIPVDGDDLFPYGDEVLSENEEIVSSESKAEETAGKEQEDADKKTVSDLSSFYKQMLTDAVQRANEAILAAGMETPSLHGMGSTATVLLLNERSAYVAYVGDSRVYQFRRHAKIFRTFDHSMVFEGVREGLITEEQARLSAESNIITRALGVKSHVEVDVFEVPYEKGDRFMLTTDGIHGAMEEKRLIRLATDTRTTLGPVADNIATTVDEIGRMAGGGHDNLTIVLLQMKTASKIKEKMTSRLKTMFQNFYPTWG